MTPVWIAAFVALWVLTLASAFLVLGILRRIVPVIQAAEEAIKASANRGPGGLAQGSAVPEFIVTDSRGTEFSDLDLRSNGAHILLFVGASCPACRGLVADLESGLAPVVGAPIIVVSDDPRHAEVIHPRDGLRVIADGGERLTRAIHSDRTPHAFVIDGDGRVAAVGSPNDWSALTALLRGAQGGEVIVRSRAPASAVTD